MKKTKPTELDIEIAQLEEIHYEVLKVHPFLGMERSITKEEYKKRLIAAIVKREPVTARKEPEDVLV